MPFDGNIAWSDSPDPERPGERVFRGYPQGLSGYEVVITKDMEEWDWVLIDDSGAPIQTRTGYATLERAQLGAHTWLKVNPNG